MLNLQTIGPKMFFAGRSVEQLSTDITAFLNQDQGFCGSSMMSMPNQKKISAFVEQYLSLPQDKSSALREAILRLIHSEVPSARKMYTLDHVSKETYDLGEATVDEFNELIWSTETFSF